MLQQNCALKLSFSYQDLASLFSVSLPSSDRIIQSVVFDTRKIIDGKNALFFALNGDFRDGHDFVQQAYEKGVRTFVVQDAEQFKNIDGTFIVVPNTMEALQLLAKSHRDKFNYPIIGITGSAGKTITKEWLSEIVNSNYRVIRSPKSYNSQLGVALSLLELNDTADLAIIEAGISLPGEMDRLQEMIRPQFGIFTSIGSAHRQNFSSEEEQVNEKLKLFKDAEKVFVHSSIPHIPDHDKFEVIDTKQYLDFITHLTFEDEISSVNASLVVACAQTLNIYDKEIKMKLESLDRIAMRLETFDGINNSVIINDTYNLDLDAFRSSLEYQLSISKGRDRMVIVGTDQDENELKKVISEFDPIETHFVASSDEDLPEFSNTIVLIKGKRSFNMERYAMRLRAKKHKTYVEVNLNAIKHNISYFKQQIPVETKVLTMVKASSYGSGIEKIGQYLDRIGVDYLGVAYADEGIELRNAGINAPILVMNIEESGFEDCIQYDLEPCIYSNQQLDSFIRRLIYEGKSHYPIHVKIETGMNRLGFQYHELPSLIDTLKSQPEVKIQSVYSHLANSDDAASNFVDEQVDRFKKAISYIEERITYTFDHHILNSEGVLNFSQYHFDMVRLGIGMYGYASNSDKLQNAIKWFSAVSQVKSINSGETIGYGRVGKAAQDMKIAVIPVGYADGFRRSLSDGKGGVIIQEQFCPTIGNVCMDMIMVDIGDLTIGEGEPVEIIGPHQSLAQLAEVMNTIPYEVLTGISKRVHRIYLED